VANRTGTYAERLIENEYVQENLGRAATNLRDAYRRASRRRVEPTRDEKLRRQVRQAALSLKEAGSALQSGRSKPKKRPGRRILVVLVVVAGGAVAAAMASSEELRQKLLGGEARKDQGTGAAPAAT
jgi:hypothetical protein